MPQPILQHFGEVIHHDDPQTKPHPTGPGRYTLIATGPAEAPALGARDRVAIQTATMLLVDDRVSDSVVALAKPNARVIHVGRRDSGLATPQAFVENLILMAVREGQHVVHLQASDAMAARRGREERARLQAAGVDVDGFSGSAGAP